MGTQVLRTESLSTAQHFWLHPCVIDQRWHFVHRPQLEKEQPEYFAKLKTYAERIGFSLLADRRSQEPANHPFKSRRRNWFPAIILSFSMHGAMADSPNSQPIELEQPKIRIELQAINPNLHNSDYRLEAHDSLKTETRAQHNPMRAKKIYRILNQHLESQHNDPEFLKEDLREMARYFSRYPSVYQLFNKLDSYSWKLRYSPENFETVVEGSRLNIDSATVHFDPRSAAQFKFNRACKTKKPYCVASPADVLLHELLHVDSILSNPKAFIASGGLNSMLYPFEHEHQTIKRETQLYRKMTELDQHPRPLRSDHTGKHVLVACVTCLSD